MKKQLSFFAILLVLGCGKELMTRPVGDEAANPQPVASAVTYPFFEFAEDAPVVVTEQVFGESHIATVGDPAAPLRLTAFIADEFGDERLAIRIHDTDLARSIAVIIAKDLGIDGFRNLPPESRCTEASYDAATRSPILARLDGLFALKGLQVILFVDEQEQSLYVGEHRLTDLTKIWFQYPDE